MVVVITKAQFLFPFSCKLCWILGFICCFFCLGLVWPTYQLYSLIGCHVHGGIHSRLRRQVERTIAHRTLITCTCVCTLNCTMFCCRHPSNLMLDRLTGRVLHIDFGDCFEVAMIREKFPEKIPFRLTRMLTNAMEVSQITVSHSGAYTIQDCSQGVKWRVATPISDLSFIKFYCFDLLTATPPPLKYELTTTLHSYNVLSPESSHP